MSPEQHDELSTEARVRTPLHAIVGLSELLSLHDLSDEAMTLVQALAREAISLSEIVEELFAGPEPRPSEPAVTAAQTSGILVIDDSEVNRLVAASQLERLGHEITGVGDGAAAIELLTTQAWDLILLDWHMPEIDGLAVLAAYHEHCRSRGTTPTPAVMMTASVSGEARRTCIDAGAADFLPKPVSFDEMARCVRRWLGDKADSHDASRANGAPEEPSAVDGIDHTVLAAMERDLGGPAAVIGVIETFVSDSEQRRADARASNDVELATRAVHTLKSTAALLGARDLSATAAALEDHHRGRNAIDDVEATLALMDRQLDQAVAALDQHRRQLMTDNQGAN